MILFFAGEDGHAKGGDSHEGHGRGDHIIGAGGGVLLGLGLGGVPGGGDDDDLSGGSLDYGSVLKSTITGCCFIRVSDCKFIILRSNLLIEQFSLIP